VSAQDLVELETRLALEEDSLSIGEALAWVDGEQLGLLSQGEATRAAGRLLLLGVWPRREMEGNHIKSPIVLSCSQPREG
jgi:hypothetical protein